MNSFEDREKSFEKKFAHSEIKISSNRSFGLVFFVVFLIIGLWPLKSGGDVRLWSLCISLVLLFLGVINSNLLNPLNKLWHKFGIFLGNFMSPIIIGAVFFLVVTPTSLLMKLFRKDILDIKKNGSKSYWIEKSGPKSKMKNQF